MKIEDIEKKVSLYRWLQGIAEEYQDMIDLIEREGTYFNVVGISYSICDETRSFNINSHRPISNRYIKEGLEEAIRDIRKEIEGLRAELEKNE